MAQRSGLVYPRKAAGLIFSPTRSLKPYVAVTKPTMVLFLVFTGMVGFVVASGESFTARAFLLASLSLILACAGANTLTCCLDRDIDAVMQRTQHRPIPSGDLSPSKALAYGLVLVFLSAAFAVQLNLLTLALIAAGVLNNVFVYSLWTKRKTWLNVIIGSIAGGLPALAGYAACSNSLDLRSLFLGAMVVVWTPVHIWSLALRYRKDYSDAKVPMLPTLIEARRMTRLIALLAALLVVVSLVPAIPGWFGAIYSYDVVILGAILLSLSVWLVLSPSERRAWTLFKASNLYLCLLFLGVLLGFVASR